MKFALQRIFQFTLHVAFWLGVLFFYTYFFGYNSSDIDYVFSFSIYLMPITIGLTYVMIYRLIPEFFLKKRYLKFALYTFYALIISSYLIVLSIFIGLIHLSNFNVGGMAPISKNIVFVMVGVYLIVILVCAFKLLKLNSEAAIKNSNLEKEFLKTQYKLKEQELNYLKMQIHPHFLFNTLNGLYGFALKKSEKTPEMILKLSNLLDYLLYQSEKPFVLLNEEISHLEDYIELEKMRFGETLDFSFKKKNIRDDYKIPPMTLLPFVENGFKHGSTVNGKKKVQMQISCNDDVLYFEIQNSADNSKNLGKGIGLENIKKRLKILYKNNFDLKITQREKSFIVKLQLKNSFNHGT